MAEIAMMTIRWRSLGRLDLIERRGRFVGELYGNHWCGVEIILGQKAEQRPRLSSLEQWPRLVGPCCQVNVFVSYRVFENNQTERSKVLCQRRVFSCFQFDILLLFIQRLVKIHSVDKNALLVSTIVTVVIAVVIHAGCVASSNFSSQEAYVHDKRST